jgi:hypothetical protein
MDATHWCRADLSWIRGQSEQIKVSVLKQFIEKYLHD